MVEERCFKCGKGREQVKLLDGIFINEVVKVCEECSVSEDIPVIRKPTTEQLKESEKNYTVYERLRRMAGISTKRQEARQIKEKEVSLDDLRERKISKEGLKERFELAKRRNVPLNLIDNFHWYVMLARKKRKLTRKELAQLLGESETAIKMIENKEFPDDANKLIAKIEQFFGLKLVTEKETEENKEEERIKDAIKERFEIEKTERLETIEKENKLVKVDRRRIEEGEKTGILKFGRESTKQITIADLQRIKEEREKKEKEELGLEPEEENLIGEEIEFEE